MRPRRICRVRANDLEECLDQIARLCWLGTLQGLGLGIAATAGVGAGIAVLWAVTGIALGRSFQKKANQNAPPSTQSH